MENHLNQEVYNTQYSYGTMQYSNSIPNEQASGIGSETMDQNDSHYKYWNEGANYQNHIPQQFSNLPMLKNRNTGKNTYLFCHHLSPISCWLKISQNDKLSLI